MSDRTGRRRAFLYLFLLLVCAVTLVRLPIASSLGLGDDEAYYWEYSRHPALSYFEHPPVLSVSIGLATQILGDTELGVRLPAILYSIVSMVFLYLLAVRATGDRRSGFFTVLGMNLIPAFSLGGMMALPDAPLAAFWTMALYFLQAESWYPAGICLGLGLLSKYHAVFLVPSAVLYLVLHPEKRRRLLTKEPYLALLIALAIFSPVLYWNSRNHWESFLFHFVSRHHGFHFHASWFFAFIGSQAGFLSPLVFGLCVWALVVLWRRWRSGGDGDALFLFAYSIVTLGFFAAVSFFSLLKPNWALMGYVPLLIAIMGPLRGRTGRGLFLSSWALSAAFTVLLLVQSYRPIVEDLVAALHLPEIPAKGDSTNDLYGWPEAGRKVAEIMAEMDRAGTPAHIFSYRYQLCAPLAFYTPGHPPVYSSARWGDSYHHWGDLFSRTGWNGIYVCDNRYSDDPRKKYRFSSIVEEPPVTVYRDGHPAHVFHIYRCYGYLGEEKGEHG